MTPLTEGMLAAVCEMEGCVGGPVREALARWYGPGSAWAWAEEARVSARCPLGEDAPTWCDLCGDPDCAPTGTTLLREVCCVLWPWAADRIRHGQYRYDDGPEGIPF